MSDLIQTAVATLNEKLDGGFDGSALFAIPGEGSILLGPDGAKEAPEGSEADVIMTADAATFRDIIEGEQDPTSAFMSGKLAIEGDMGAAMRLAGALG